MRRSPGRPRRRPTRGGPPPTGSGCENRRNCRRSHCGSSRCTVWTSCGTPTRAIGVRADAAVAFEPDRVCAVMTADCLPVVLARPRRQRRVAVAHAGWRGLLGGVLEGTVAELGGRECDLHAWLGPAIGPEAFEVGAEVREAYVARVRGSEACFRGTSAVATSRTSTGWRASCSSRPGWARCTAAGGAPTATTSASSRSAATASPAAWRRWRGSLDGRARLTRKDPTADSP